MSLATDFNDAWKERLRSGNDNFYDFIDELHLEEIHNKVVGKWRWGTIHEVIGYSHDTDSYIRIRWYESGGDAEIDSYDMNVEATDVRPKQVTTTVYV